MKAASSCQAPKVSSAFVPDPAQQFPPLLPVHVRFHTLWGEAVHDAGGAPTLRGGGDQYMERVGRGAEDAADLGTVLYLVEDVDRVRVTEQDAEDVTGADRLEGGDAPRDQLVVVSLGPDQAGTGGLSKG